MHVVCVRACVRAMLKSGRQRVEEKKGGAGRMEGEEVAGCACGSLTTVTHTNRNIPNKLQAFRGWQADIFSVRGTISYLRRKVESPLDQIASHRDARGLA